MSDRRRAPEAGPFVVVGAEEATGHHVAAALVAAGATVAAICRYPDRGAREVAALRAGGTDRQVELWVADPASQPSIRRLAEGLRERHRSLAAVVHVPDGRWHDGRDPSPPQGGVAADLAGGHLGPFLLASLLADRLGEGGVLAGVAPADVDDLPAGLLAVGTEEMASVLGAEGANGVGLAQVATTLAIATRAPSLRGLTLRLPATSATLPGAGAAVHGARLASLVLEGTARGYVDLDGSPLAPPRALADPARIDAVWCWAEASSAPWRRAPILR